MVPTVQQAGADVIHFFKSILRRAAKRVLATENGQLIVAMRALQDENRVYRGIILVAHEHVKTADVLISQEPQAGVAALSVSQAHEVLASVFMVRDRTGKPRYEYVGAMDRATAYGKRVGTAA